MKSILFKLKGNGCTVYKKGVKSPFLTRKLKTNRFFLLKLPFNNYTIEGCEIVMKKIVPQGTPDLHLFLPPVERETKRKKYKLIYAPNHHSPASIGVEKGYIVYNKYFTTLPKAFQEFIMFHEKGHRHYETEKYCDLFASLKMLKKGFGKSVALQCLRFTLRNENKEKAERYNYVSKILKRI